MTYKLNTKLNHPEQDIEFVKIEIVNINTFFFDGMELKAHLQLLVAKQRSFQRVRNQEAVPTIVQDNKLEHDTIQIMPFLRFK